ncbi:MAG TPA: SDR family oxidoreductase [Polyangiaceae bacterium]|nr:SDR family oxidoreductase [Polyangiaceae bacterium]
MSRFDTISSELLANPARWLVTGAAGFIGSHLVEALLRLNQEVVGLDNFATGYQSNLDDVLDRVGDKASRFHFVEGDVRDRVTCLAAMDGARFVLHEAAIGSVPRSIDDPMTTHTNNVDGFVTLLLAAQEARIERVVYASSSSVYGDDKNSPKLESQIGRPLSPYATSKLVDELYAETLLRTHRIDSVGLRYFNVFGPRQDPNGAYAAVIPRWTEQLLSGKPSLVFGDGSNSRDFCFVDNVVQANLLAATASETEVAPRVFNVAYGARTTLLELYEAIRERAAQFAPEAREAPLERRPPRAGDIPHSLAAIDRARACFGYEPAFDLRRGLDVTVAWYASRAGQSAASAPKSTRSLKEPHELLAYGHQQEHHLSSTR